MDKKLPFYFYVSILWTWPNDILVFLIVLFFRLFWAENCHWNYGLWCVLRKGSWPARTWFKGWGAVALGHGGIINYGRAGGPGVDTKLEFHEQRFHVKQIEVILLVFFTFAVIAHLTGESLTRVDLTEKVFTGLWPVGFWVTYFLGIVMSVLRGDEAYKENIFEDAAYIDQDDFEKMNHSDK